MSFSSFNTFNKPFGSTSTGFNNNTFGQPTVPSFSLNNTSTFGQPTQTTFGQPAQTTGFGQTTQPGFGQTTQPGFGQTTQPGFGQQNTSTFGGNSFGQTNTSIFGNTNTVKPAFGTGSTGFGTSTFGQQPTSTFGQQPASTTFGQQPTSTFGQPTQSGFGGFGTQSQPSQQGTKHTPFTATETETDPKTNAKMIFQTITALPIYSSYSLEELRCQDLGISTPLANKNNAAAPVSFATPSNTGFGANSSTFGFGQQQPGNTGFSFGTQNQQKSTSFSGFGSTTTSTPSFGTTAPTTTGFGSTSFVNTGFGAQTQSAQKPAFSFGGTSTTTAAPSSTNFGAFGTPAATITAFGAPSSTGFGTSTFGQQPTTLFGQLGSQPGSTASTTSGFGGGFGAPSTNFGTPSTNTFQFGGGSSTGSSFGGFGSSTTVKPATFGNASTAFGGPSTTNQFNFNKPATTTAPLQFGSMAATAGQMSLPPGAVVVTLGSASVTDQDPFRFPDVSKLYSSSNSSTTTSAVPTSSPLFRGPASPNVWKTAVPPKIHVQSKPRHYHLANVAANRNGNTPIASISNRNKATFNGENPLQALGEAELLETDRFLAAMKSSRTLNSMEIPKEIEISPSISNEPPVCSSNSGLTLYPSIEDLHHLSYSNLSNVHDFRITHEFGELLWPGKTDLNGVNFDSSIAFEPRTVEVYPEHLYCADVNDRKLKLKPVVGTKLNKACQVTLYNCWPLNKDKQRVKTKDEVSLEKYKQLLIQSCLKQHIKFIDYNSSNGDWKFEVEHF